MRKFRFSKIVFTAVLAAASTMFIMVAGQAKQTQTIAVESKQLSKQEWERARNYFTDTQLVDRHGRQVRFYSDVLDGRVVLMNVMYSSCQGACPMMTKMLTQIKDELGNRFGTDIYFVSISNDPERDTPAALSKFAEKQNATDKGWYFLTGEKDKINRVIKKLGFYTENFEEHTSLLIAGNTRTGHWIKIKPSSPLPGIVLRLNQLADEG